MTADHKHAYESVPDTRPWWRRVFGEVRGSELRCSICRKGIDAIIADLEAEEAAIKSRLEEALSNLPRQPKGQLDYEFDGYNEIGAMG